MKKPLIWGWLVWLLPLLFISCQDETPSDNPDPVTISGIFPNSNPIGGPVLIEGEGFNDNTAVYFNTQKATIEERTPHLLTTKVPSGLGATTVTLRVENSWRFDTQPFDVLSEFPSDLPSSPPSIILPSGGLTAPISFTISDIDIVHLMNVYDTTHTFRIVIKFNSDDPVTLSYKSNERIILNGTNYQSPLTVNGANTFPNLVSSDEPIISSMEIKRSDSNPLAHPHRDDALSGKFVTIPSFPFPNIALQYKGAALTNNFLLLTSQITGRQYLLVVLCYDFFDEGCP
ncbi:MAG: IPT/TIG domain-containing protein [Cyclobacteriaceae bacterium]